MIHFEERQHLYQMLTHTHIYADFGEYLEVESQLPFQIH